VGMWSGVVRTRVRAESRIRRAVIFEHEVRRRSFWGHSGVYLIVSIAMSVINLPSWYHLHPKLEAPVLQRLLSLFLRVVPF
jgi:hypothetical protein